MAKKIKSGLIRKTLVSLGKKKGVANPRSYSNLELFESVLPDFPDFAPKEISKSEAREFAIWYIQAKRKEKNTPSWLTKSAPTYSEQELGYKAFYKSWEWREVRFLALEKYGRRCQCCGAAPNQLDMSGNSVRIVVDHIKPIRHYWALRLSLDNLQILCDECNMGKSHKHETDFRADKGAKT